MSMLNRATHNLIRIRGELHTGFSCLVGVSGFLWGQRVLDFIAFHNKSFCQIGGVRNRVRGCQLTDKSLFPFYKHSVFKLKKGVHS